MIEQTYRYIVAVDGIRSGRPIVEGSRIGVHDVVGLYINGATVDAKDVQVLALAAQLHLVRVIETISWSWPTNSRTPVS